MSGIDVSNKSYDYATVTCLTGQTNRDMKANNATIFNNVLKAKYFRITTDASVTIRFNDVNNPAIPLTAAGGSYIWKRLEQGMCIENFYITNSSGGTATMIVEMYQ